jgi:hypothetical protein
MDGAAIIRSKDYTHTHTHTHTLIYMYIFRMDLGEVGCGDVDWIGLAQDRDRGRALVNSVLNFRVP